jgi:hypothetical protein
MNQFEHILDLPPQWGRPVCMSPWRGDIIIAMEYGPLIRVSENPLIGQVYVQEIYLTQPKPMPSPI